MKSKSYIDHNENTVLTSILKSIHHRMTPNAKKIIKAHLILTGKKEFDFKEIQVQDFCAKKFGNNTIFFGQNLQFENVDKQIITIDFVLIKNGVLYLCDFQFSARVERRQVRKGLQQASLVKDWLQAQGHSFVKIQIGSYYWGRQKKVVPIEHMFLSRDFCMEFTLDFPSIEKEIKQAAKLMFKESIDSKDFNKIGFEALLNAGEDGLKKYNPTSQEDQVILF